MKTNTETRCVVCDRVNFGDTVPLGFGKWRHAACYPGSDSWVDNYPLHAPTEEGDFIYQHAMKLRGET